MGWATALISAIVGGLFTLAGARVYIRSRKSESARDAGLRAADAAYQARREAGAQLAAKRIETAEAAFSCMLAGQSAVADIVTLDTMFNHEAVIRVSAADFGEGNHPMDTILATMLGHEPFRDRTTRMLGTEAFQNAPGKLLFLPQRPKLVYQAHLTMCARLAAHWSPIWRQASAESYNWRLDRELQRTWTVAGLPQEHWDRAARANRGGLNSLFQALQEYFAERARESLHSPVEEEQSVMEESIFLAKAAILAESEFLGNRP